MSQTQADDARLLAATHRGSEAAFATLYQRHRMPVFRFVRRFLGSQHAAEDVTQECFLSLFAGAAFNPGHGPLRTYLFGIARHLAIRRVRLEDREAEEQADAAAPYDILGDLIGQERSAAVERAVGALPPLQKEAVILFEYEECSLEEIANIVGVDVGAVKARLHRARETLKRRLAPLVDAPAQPSPARRIL